MHEPSNGSYVFRRESPNVWLFVFGGEMQRVGGHRKGFEFLAQLISKPNVRFEPLDLDVNGDRESHQVAARAEGVDEMLDAQARREVKRRIEELQRLVAEEENPALEEELRQLMQLARRARGWGGKPTSLGTTGRTRAYKRVHAAIARTLEALREQGMEALAEHLMSCSTPDQGCFVYREPQPMTWDVSWIVS